MEIEASDLTVCYINAPNALTAAVTGFVVGALLAALKAIFQANAFQTGTTDLSNREIEIYKPDRIGNEVQMTSAE